MGSGAGQSKYSCADTVHIILAPRVLLQHSSCVYFMCMDCNILLSIALDMIVIDSKSLVLKTDIV